MRARGLPERFEATERDVLVRGGVCGAAAHSLHHMGRRGQIRVALAKIDHIESSPLKGLGG